MEGRDGGRLDRAGRGGRTLAWISGLILALAILVPNNLNRITFEALLRLPVEAIVAGLLAVVVGGTAGTVLRRAIGAAIGLLLVVKLADIGAYQAFARPFDLVLDWSLLRSAMHLLGGAVGPVAAAVLAVLAALSAVLLVVVLAVAADRAGLALRAHRRVAGPLLAVLLAGWAVLFVSGVVAIGRTPVATNEATRLTLGHAQKVREGLADRAAFAAEARDDPLEDIPADRLLAGLRGKDVIVAFIESYGRAALDDDRYRPAVEAVLTKGDARLNAAGLGVRSGWLTSPTVGGQSWLAHGTLLSGLWIGNQQRYDTLVASDRMTLNAAFRKAGWRTVALMPAITMAWPEGAFFGYDAIYAAGDLGYRGKPFNWVTMPDQYTLSAFERLEQPSRSGRPVMAEIALISSHAPWTPIPRRISWEEVGDGRVFDAMATAGDPPEVVWRDPERVRLQYRLSLEYALDVLVSYAETFGGPDLVIVALGDHQPAPLLTGETDNRDVPVHIISGDPAVLERFADWGWTAGLRPDGDLPAKPMSGFRDRFVRAFTPPADGAGS